MSLDSAGLPDDTLEARAAHWVAYVRRETTRAAEFRPGRRQVKVHHADLALWLADLADKALQP